MQSSILVVDDEHDFLVSVRRALTTASFKNITLVEHAPKALGLMESGRCFDVALIDITMPSMDGVSLLEAVKHISPETECIMVTAVNEAKTAISCLKKGAYDYLVKPFTSDDLIIAIRRALERKRLLRVVELAKEQVTPGLSHPAAFQSIITDSVNMKRLLKEAELHAVSDVPILITGESGTGKELLARAIHQTGDRKNHPFTPINMASVNANLFEAEFFGYVRGAFTGAGADRVGYLEHSHRGTLFLDEIGLLPTDLQGKLLRILQEGEYLKLGTSTPKTADVRFIAATNMDLDRLVASGAFRKDLFYRLRGAMLHCPPLRERAGDIPLLANTFLSAYAGETGSFSIDEDALIYLLGYAYPGNVRELKAIIQSSANLAHGGRISARSLPLFIKEKAARAAVWEESGSIQPLAEVEKDHIRRVYHRLNGNKARTSKALGISINTLKTKLELYRME